MRRLSDAEWNVMNVLWGAAVEPDKTTGSVALGEVVDELKPVTGWSRNTVLTYLTRMEGKGLVAIDREEEPHKYMAAASREECAVKERKNLLNRVYGGAAGDMIAAFLKETKISSEERDELRKLLDEMEV